jgi:isopentenyl diphosphate isomerase/L-lactate dehydrogenase-like FMN-dependent dehydrogenase
MQDAVQMGCKAVCLTIGLPAKLRLSAGPPLDWAGIDRVRQGLKVPFLLKGIMDPEEARVAVQRGINGLVVSNHAGMLATGLAEPIEVLPAVVDAVGGKIPVLVDGSFRRGTDI